jgi:hypothetical protein
MDSANQGMLAFFISTMVLLGINVLLVIRVRQLKQLPRQQSGITNPNHPEENKTIC